VKAAIETQGSQTKTTVDFIEKVGFIHKDPNSDAMLMDETKELTKKRFVKTIRKGSEPSYCVTS
jgi:ribosomal protein S16